MQITVVDRAAEISIPEDVVGALRAQGVLASFQARPKGRQRYTIRWIGEAAKIQARDKGIWNAVEIARRKRESS